MSVVFQSYLVDIGFTMLNLGIFALNLKIYTEILKDKSQDRRVKG